MAPNSEARFVVAVDFGTTFSGYAYAKRSEPERIFTCYDWPCFAKAGAKPYCKTLTALYYVSQQDKPGTFTLQDWGWPAFLKYLETTRRRQSARAADNHIDKRICISDKNLHVDQNPLDKQICISEENFNVNNVVDALMVPQSMHSTLGFFATKFKLYLTEDIKPLPKFSGDISTERMIVDYLRLISEFIMSDLQQKYGKHVGKEDVQWCLTVPAIWDESAKQVMKICAEKAGMVRGATCPNPAHASPHALDIILEPESASVYCQHKVRHLSLRKGDKMLIADVGGGTIDLVVHEKADDDPESLKVHEVVGSYGELGGGTFVDNHFFQWVCQKIGCFKQFCCSNPTVAIKLYEWWQSIKMGFDGDGYSAEWPLPGNLRDAWKSHDAEKGPGYVYHDDYYEDLELEDSDIKQIFNREVYKVLRLIQRQIRGVRVLMVVGGFSSSPYLRKRVQESFGSMVEEIITPEDPGSAICHGAVQLHIHNETIQSRIAKRTYGIETSGSERDGDPVELCYVNDDGWRKCGSIFSVFVRVGDRVPLHHSITHSYWPVYHNQRRVSFTVFSSPNKCPRYTTDAGVNKEGTFVVDISKDMELDKDRKIEVKMCFGASLINVSARRLNFGDPTSLQGLTVSFSTCT